MDYYQRHDLRKLNDQSDEFALIIYLDDDLTEFSNELGSPSRSKRDLMCTAKELIKERYPNLKVTMVKIVLGGLVVTSIPLNTGKASAQAVLPTTNNGQAADSSTIYYRVSSGDTLWIIARKFNTSVDHIKRANKLTSDVLQLNERLIIPKAFHTVKTGDYLTVLAKNYGTTVHAIKEANKLTSDTTQLGQTLIIPALIGQTQAVETTKAVPSPAPTSNTYTVVSGDSLSVIASRFGVSVDALRSANQLTSDFLRIGQVLTIPNGASSSVAPPPAKTTAYTVVSGDSLSVLAKRFGVSVDALRSANQLTSDFLRIGQVLTIPDGASSSVTPAPAKTTAYTVVSGDSLSVIASRFRVSVDTLRSANQLTSDFLRIGQVLTIPDSSSSDTASAPSTYTVVSADSLWGIASRFRMTVDDLRNVNNLNSDTLQVGQTLTIAKANAGSTQASVQEQRTTFTYHVASGDSLSVIAKRFDVTVDAVRTANNLKTDILQMGQALSIPNGANAPAPSSINSLSYITHTIVSGDNMWNLSVQYGIPQAELLKVNGLTTSSVLTVGQKLQIPVYNIAVKPVVSAKHGELLDWWTEAQYVFSIGKTAKVTDFATGKSFYIKRTIGANHADSETVTTNDSNIAKTIWGGYSWTPRAVILEVDGRKLAASMSFMPHEREYIMNNGITGHFDVYFSNSTRHKDGRADAAHQAQVERAAGIR